MMAQHSSPKKRKAGNTASSRCSTAKKTDYEQEGRATKKIWELASSLSEEFTCAITHELMVDPVTADDGNTYERSAIIQWFETNTKSPMDPSTTIDPSRLIGSRAIFKSIEKLVLSGDIDEELRTEWFARKKKSDLIKSKKLFDEGKVLEAANLGLPKAQGAMAKNHFYGHYGFAYDLGKCFEFATKAAEGGDVGGQFLLGVFFSDEINPAKDYRAALEWFEIAAVHSAFAPSAALNTARIYEIGGYGVQKDLNTSFTWFKKAADQGLASAQCAVGEMFYNGKGVAKDLSAARTWYERSADQGNAQGECRLAIMTVKGEGGPQSLGAGTVLLEKAAAHGDTKATELLSSFEAHALIAFSLL